MGIAVAVVVAISIVVGLAVLPINHAFAGGFSVPRLHLGHYTLDVPDGAMVSGTWTSTGGASFHFDVVDGTDYPIYQSNGTHGSFSFPASSPPYTFEGLTTANVTESISVSGIFASPVL